ncbi:uncharacterized protein LOC124264998 [Haliotis rubra]|uniref:uncharacterized protein LOC124264998 n=1 Tax=Haliotis rubra TaxID=36100 RepID=UPI001EE52E9C|nr:uncharacterized protein LOC124264998 [Haliotis rubra]
MALQASMLTPLLQAVRIALLFGHLGVSGLDLGRIFKATYSRGHRPDVNVTSIMMTCPVSRTLHCERLCTMTSGCMSFYYNPLQGTCQFYSDAARCPADKTHQNGSKHTDLYFYRREGGQKAQQRRWTRLLYGPIWSKERLMVVSYYGSTKRIVAVGDDLWKNVREELFPVVKIKSICSFVKEP